MTLQFVATRKLGLMTGKKSTLRPALSLVLVCRFAGPTQDLLELMIIMMISMMMVGSSSSRLSVIFTVKLL